MKNCTYLILALTTRCNLRCAYCYMNAGAQGSDMSKEVVDRAFSLLSGRKRVLVQMTGGEPCLVPELVDYVGWKARRSDAVRKLAIQTNATLISSDMISLFRNHHMDVGISIDGLPAVHDRLRGSAWNTIRGMQLLEAEGVDFRVTTVITHENVAVLYRLALLLGGFSHCRGIGLDLLVEKGRAETARVRPAGAEAVAGGVRRLVETLEVINGRRRRAITLRELELLERGCRDRPFCRAASGRSLGVMPDGALYPCGQTMGNEDFRMGSVYRPQIPQRPFLSEFTLSSEECNSCQLSGRCPGDCPSRILHAKRGDLACYLYRGLMQGVLVRDLVL